MEERLQKVLARAGVASRRRAEQLITEGRVAVNGQVVRELGTKVDASADVVRVDGTRLRLPQGPVYLALYKPRGVVSTRSDPEGRETVMSLVPQVAGLFPVGRLDVTTEGLILLTNDGAFAERISHPRYEVPRVYQAKVRGVPDEAALDRLRRGVEHDGERLSVDRARVLEADNNAWVELTLHEGKRHEVRRMLEAIGHPVSKLKRVAFGPVTTRGLAPGQFRPLTEEELAGLLRGEGRRKPPPRPRVRRPPPRPRAEPRAGSPARERLGRELRREQGRPQRGRSTARGHGRPRLDGTARPTRGRRPGRHQG